MHNTLKLIPVVLLELASLLLATSLNLSHAQPLELPFHKPDQNIVSHSGYTLLYNEAHEQAEWVAYELTAREVTGGYDRSDDFRADPAILTGSASLSDYRGSGYDRGHLIPAADAAWSAGAMSASFYLSNMSPQHPSFNRGGWKALEELVRRWARENGSVYVVTGPALSQGIVKKIGRNGVSIPRYYYKVILDYREPGLRGIGFIMPNEKLKDPAASYAVTIDSVEVFTGLDFYYALKNAEEEALESALDLALWGLTSPRSETASHTTSGTSTENYSRSASTAARCLGTTQKGRRCKRKTSNASGYCWQHQSQVSNK